MRALTPKAPGIQGSARKAKLRSHGVDLPELGFGVETLCKHNSQDAEAPGKVQARAAGHGALDVHAPWNLSSLYRLRCEESSVSFRMSFEAEECCWLAAVQAGAVCYLAGRGHGSQDR